MSFELIISISRPLAVASVTLPNDNVGHRENFIPPRLGVTGDSFRFPAPTLLVFPTRVYYTASSASRTNTISGGSRDRHDSPLPLYIGRHCAWRFPRGTARRVASRRVVSLERDGGIATAAAAASR